MVSMDVKHHVYLLTRPAQSPGEIKRREVVLHPQVSPGEVKSRQVELGGESRISVLLQVVTQQRCTGHCPGVPAQHSS